MSSSDGEPTPQAPPTAARRQRILIGGAALGLAVAIALLITALSLRGNGDQLDLRADPISPSRDAPLTAGTGHDGQPISTPTAGRPAVVTFLFTDCPDICPMAAATIRQALEIAGPETDVIDITAVSVDPRGDTPAKVREFLTRHRLDGRMDYLIGSQQELTPLWKAWMVAAQPVDEPNSAHSARIVLIDRRGRQVGSYAAGIPVPTDALAADLLTLARSG